jgi:pilus assembly protein Flp/PilA
MHVITNTLRRDDRGATAVEYALMAAAIAAAIVAIVFVLGGQVSSLFESATSLWAAQ